MPIEKGEKRQEKAAKSREDDSGGDYLEWCLREYEKTMNKLEGHAPKKMSEEPQVFIDGFIGKETIPKKEEAELNDGKTMKFDAGEGRIIIHEDQEPINKPTATTSSGETARASRIEEHKTDVDQTSQSTNKGAQLSHSSDNNLHREEERGGQEAERGRKAAGEPSQTSEQRQQQHGKSEPTQHGEIPPTEQHQPNNTDKHGQEETTDSTKTRGEGDASSRTDADHPNPDKAAGEQATDAIELNEIRVHDAMVAHAGDLIREWRKELGLTQYGLADKLGHGGSEVSCWESNKVRTRLEDLQQLSRIAGRDLEQGFRGLQSSGSQGITMEWKGAAYSIDAFTESIRNPHATLNFNEAQQTYYLKISPLANVEFHRGDIVTTLLEKDGVQAIAELKALKGARADIKKADVERMGIKVGDKLRVDVLNVRGPEDSPWRQSIQVEPTTTNGETKIQLAEKLGELRFNVRDGNYARMVIQTERGEGLATGRIENGAIKLSENIANELLTRGGNREADTLEVKTDSIVLSPEPITEKTHLRVKTRDRITLKLEGEGFTITHENQNYRITTVEREKIGDLELYRFKTNQGEEFLRIPRENKRIPPYETPWYALPPTTQIYLDKEYKHELLKAAIGKAGGQTALRQELQERKTYVNKRYLDTHLNERQGSMRADKLIPILTYLGRELDELNSHITAMGHMRAVENPNLPFKLNTVDGARLLAARFSDGSLPAFQDGETMFAYINNDAEQRNRIVDSLANVFGRANMPNSEYDDGRIADVRTTTKIIGYALRRSGAITGEVVTQNPDMPTFILQGSKEMKREWLKQAFGDEGSPWPQRGLVKLPRVADPTHRLSDEQKNRLDALSEEWKIKQFPNGWRESKRCRFDDLPEDIQGALEPGCPRLLESEARILHSDFGISIKKYPSEIYTREGGYGVTWVLQTASREDSRVFYNEIGFPQNRKQERLRSALRMKEDGNH